MAAAAAAAAAATRSEMYLRAKMLEKNDPEKMMLLLEFINF